MPIAAIRAKTNVKNPPKYPISFSFYITKIMNFLEADDDMARAGLPHKKRMAATIELIAANYTAHAATYFLIPIKFNVSVRLIRHDVIIFNPSAVNNELVIFH